MLPEGFKRRIVRWMEDNRGLIIVSFVLPMSFLFDLVLRTHRWILIKTGSGPKKHDDRVRKIQESVLNWYKSPKEKRRLMCTSRPNWLSLSTTFFQKDQCHKIPVALHDILSLNERSLTVRVEPMVSVQEITDYLIPRGYTLAITLEIGDATLGGLAMGVGMTTYSHKVGLYQEGVVAYEVVLGNGSLVRATADNEHADLYKALPWSHGSLGFLVALELKIIPVKPYIHLKYTPVFGQKQYCDRMRQISGALDKNDEVADYVEGTIYSLSEAVLMEGNFADRKDHPSLRINAVNRWYKPWFYKYVESKLERGPYEELIPLQDYLLRHNRAIFWVVESMIPFGNNPWFRFFFGWLLPPKPAFLKFTTTPGVRAMTFTKQVFQDIVLPLNQLEEQVQEATKLFNTFPLLVYPCRIYDHGKASGQLKPPKPNQLVPGADYAMFNDLGVYGVPGPVKEKKAFDAVHAMREMERFTRDVGGYSFLYADIFMNREEFEEMFDLTLYERVRRQYHAEGAFPHLYDKVKPEIDVIAVGKAYEKPL